MMIVVAWFSLLVLSAVFAFYWILAMIKGAPYYPSNAEFIQVLLEVLKDKPRARIVEIGSGDGRVAVALAKKGYHVTAIEINPVLTLITRLWGKLARAKSLTVVQADVFGQSFRDYDFAVAYLYPGIMRRLEPKLYQELPNNSVIISNTFSFKQHKPDKIIAKRFLIYNVQK